MTEEIDELGKFVMENLRDVSIELCHGLLERKYKSPGHREIQDKLLGLDKDQKRVIETLITYCIDGGINDFLYRLDKESRTSRKINILVNGTEATSLTESLSKELYGESGWQSKYSKFSKIYT